MLHRELAGHDVFMPAWSIMDNDIIVCQDQDIKKHELLCACEGSGAISATTTQQKFEVFYMIWGMQNEM